MRISKEILERAERGLSPHPQHRALPARQPRRLRSGARSRRARRSCSSSTASSSTVLQGLIERCRRAYDALRVPRRLPRAQQLLQRRSLGALPRHRQGSPLLRGRRRRASGAPGRRRCYHLLEAWCASWRRSCRSRPRRSGATCPPTRRGRASVLLADFPAVDPDAPRPAARGRMGDAARGALGGDQDARRAAAARATIGHSLEADVRIAAGGPVAAVLDVASRRSSPRSSSCRG